MWMGITLAGFTSCFKFPCPLQLASENHIPAYFCPQFCFILTPCKIYLHPQSLAQNPTSRAQPRVVFNNNSKGLGVSDLIYSALLTLLLWDLASWATRATFWMMFRALKIQGGLVFHLPGSITFCLQEDARPLLPMSVRGHQKELQLQKSFSFPSLPVQLSSVIHGLGWGFYFFTFFWVVEYRHHRDSPNNGYTFPHPSLHVL